MTRPTRAWDSYGVATSLEHSVKLIFRSFPLVRGTFCPPAPESFVTALKSGTFGQAINVLSYVP